jgi:hypothetical protein
LSYRQLIFFRISGFGGLLTELGSVVIITGTVSWWFYFLRFFDEGQLDKVGLVQDLLRGLEQLNHLSNYGVRLWLG